MKRIFPLILVALCGCTSTEFHMGDVSLKRTAFLQKLDIKELRFGTNGTALLKGYGASGDTDMISAAAEGAAKGAAAAAK